MSNAGKADQHQDSPLATGSRAAGACPAGDQAPARLQRLAVVVGRLARESEDRHVRAQLHALRALVEREQRDAARGPADTGALERELADAMRDGHEERAIAVAQRLARAERALVGPLDWNAISGG